MFRCSCCNVLCNTPSLLVTHYKFSHNYTDSSIYTCNENDCLRIFSSSSKLVRHLKVKHTLREHVTGTNLLFNDISSTEVQDENSSSNVESSTNDTLPFDNDQKNSNSFSEKSNIDNEFVNINELKDSLKVVATSFISKFYSISYLPRNMVQIIVEETCKLFNSKIFERVKELVVSQLTDERIIRLVYQLFSILENPFENLETEYKRKMYFMKTKQYIPPKSVFLGEKLASVKCKGERIFKNIDIKIQYVPMTPVIKTYLESHDNFEVLKSNMRDLDSAPPSMLTDFCQGSLWSDIKVRNPNKFLVPLLMYHDDFNVGNVLGSHSKTGMMGVVYYMIGGFPAHYMSNLNNIFVATIFEAELKEDFPYNDILESLFEELLDLETNGIEIEVDGKSEKVYFSMGGFFGDNLAAHGVLGFVEGFRANFPCRHCKISKEQMQFCTREIETLNRTIENYENDLQVNDVSLTGIKYNCIFNKLPNFHVTKNKAGDITHDVFLGVARTDVCLLINYILSNPDKKYPTITLNMLNSRIVNFDYGVDSSDKPPPLTENQLKSGSITIYSAEMATLIKYLPILLGDFLGENSEVWKWFLIFREICEIIQSKSIQTGITHVLADHIHNYLTLREKLFPSESKKPKHHNMVHTPMYMLLLGPASRISTIRFEAKHQMMISYARNCKNKINLPLSMAVKHQLALTYHFLNNTKDVDICSNKKPCTLQALPDFPFFQYILPSVFLHEEETYKLKYYKLKGFTYSINNLIVIDVTDIFPTFLQIKHIIYQDKINEYIFIGKVWKAIGVNDHTQYYWVIENNKWQVVKTTKLLNYPALNLMTSSEDGEKYVTIYL